MELVLDQMPSRSGSSDECFVHDAKVNKSTEVLGEVKLEILAPNDEKLEISRAMRVTALPDRKVKFQNLSSQLRLTNEHGESRDVTLDMDLRMHNALGVSDAILNSVIFCHQEDSTWPLDDGQKVKERFDEIFDSEKYSECFEHLKKLRKDYSHDIKLLAFDTVKWSALWSSLRRRGIPECVIRIIRSLYEGSTCRVIHEKEMGAPIQISAGVKQGCLLSPLLFIILLDDVMRRVVKTPRGISWHTKVLEDLDYADDIVLISPSLAHLKAKLESLQEEAEAMGLRINRRKTVNMRVQSACKEPLLLKNDRLESVSKFVYLGSTLSCQGGADDDVESRIKKAKAAFAQLKPVWDSNVLTRRVKISLFESIVKTVLLFGCETWRVTKGLTHKLQVFVNKSLRSILRIFWPKTIRNENLWKQDVDHLFEKKEELEKKKLDVENIETQITEANAKIEELSKELEEVSAKLETIKTMEKSIVGLENKRDKIKVKLENFQTQEKELKNTIKSLFEGTVEELNESIASHGQTVQDKQKELIEIYERKSAFDKEREKIENEMTYNKVKLNEFNFLETRIRRRLIGGTS
ncbi:DNA repair protein RAD50-like [Leguminivora glycinivorella]|uniref:DNA repair protein RAD50-like n=1 Tax=Leguminivora glycinivorella TaxID=1035111 RepID=UPI00200C3D7F|nr:DNA repair protein RAD50-like [Leguminivora glycinivorella]